MRVVWIAHSFRISSEFINFRKFGDSRARSCGPLVLDPVNVNECNVAARRWPTVTTGSRLGLI